MKKRKISGTFIIGITAFFLTTAFLTTVAVIVYGTISARTENKAVITGVMLSVVIFLAVVCTVIDWLRRRVMIDRPVKRILSATDKIAAGDFTVRMEVTHSYGHYDGFDYIMENLNKMAAELSRTEVLHTDFISNVSHEIKTPLAIIQNYATSLKNKNLDEQTRVKYAETLADAAKRLTALITNILQLNKLENQKLIPENKTVNLTEILSESVLGFEEMIESKGLELDCDFDEDVNVLCYPAYLEIIWNNLLSNAIKFTDSGGKISISLKQENGRATVKISDTGCGISAETGKHIFEKFYQGDTSHAQEGNGLGLALVKKVIDITGGTIAVNSELGRGTTFTVTLQAEE